jgi:hypothetical protein
VAGTILGTGCDDVLASLTALAQPSDFDLLEAKSQREVQQQLGMRHYQKLGLRLFNKRNTTPCEFKRGREQKTPRVAQKIDILN